MWMAGSERGVEQQNHQQPTVQGEAHTSLGVRGKQFCQSDECQIDKGGG